MKGWGRVRMNSVRICDHALSHRTYFSKNVVTAPIVPGLKTFASRIPSKMSFVGEKLCVRYSTQICFIHATPAYLVYAHLLFSVFETLEKYLWNHMCHYNMVERLFLCKKTRFVKYGLTYTFMEYPVIDFTWYIVYEYWKAWSKTQR